jgi:integrase
VRQPRATLAAATGATTKELMRRLGHSSPAAAIVYQHAADDRDVEIASALDAILSAASGLLSAAPAAHQAEPRSE